MKPKMRNRSVQDLIGIQTFTPRGLAVKNSELVFYAITPTNISVLSAASMDGKIRQTLTVLAAAPELEILCLDSRASFDSNKQYLDRRMEEESNSAVRELLSQDRAMLDGMLGELAADRQFVFMLRLKSGSEEQRFSLVHRTEKLLADQGFAVKLLDKSGIQRLLALYFGASTEAEQLEDYDGQTVVRRLFGRQRELTEVEKRAFELKSFVDLVLPSTIRFFADHYVCGDHYDCVWAIREYPPSTEEQALLAHLADRRGVTLRIYNRPVESMEQRKIIQNATRKNRLMSGGNDMQETVTAEGNLLDVTTMLANLRRDREPLLHTAVFLELRAGSREALKARQEEVWMELTRSKITVDRLILRQKEGFLSALPVGANQFGAQFERVLPASSVANMFPFGYSGRTDPQGLYIGRDKYGSNLLVDFERRAADKTNANVLILGNSGQGKSYLLKLLLTNFRESGKAVVALDAEEEYRELTQALGGCYVDFLSGEYHINPLEPRFWGEAAEESEGQSTPEPFQKSTRLSQHLAYLKDFFRAYKDFPDAQIDAIEILLSQLYDLWGISDRTDFNQLQPTDYPTLAEFYALVEKEYHHYNPESHPLYTQELLRELCLGLHSLCVGAESRYFNGHTNLADDRFLCFGIKALWDTNRRLKDAVLFNLLSYMSHRLLNNGNTVASFDEVYLFLSNRTAIEYIRNAMKRVRKKDSAVVLASQNLDDFLLEGVREYTKPLFSIPTHQFLFNAGNVEPKAYLDTLQLDPSEFALIQSPEQGTCLYRCGAERYLLKVTAPAFKKALFGTAGGK